MRIYHLTRMRQKNLILFTVRVFVLAFVVEIEYNRIIYKTQPQKLIFFSFSFSDESHPQNSTSKTYTPCSIDISGNYKLSLVGFMSIENETQQSNSSYQIFS
jgi:hypothetical protein